jgi:hypothetical protein
LGMTVWVDKMITETILQKYLQSALCYMPIDMQGEK